jgi:hypothetical protein
MNKDPILTVIAEHKRIYKAWKKQDCPEDGPLSELYADVSQRLFETPPSTITGVLALLNYVIKGKHDRYGYWGAWQMPDGELLRSIRKGLTVAMKQDATG